MPASDDHFYSIKRLHVIFAVSALALLGVTVWMLAADHFRNWKQYQRTYRDRVEPWLTEAELRAEETESFRQREAALRAELAEAEAAAPQVQRISALVAALPHHAPTDHRDESAESALDLAAIRAAAAALANDPGAEAKTRLIAVLDRNLTELNRRLERLDQQWRFATSDFDQARSTYEANVGRGVSPKRLAKLQQQVDRFEAEVRQLRRSLDEAYVLRAAVRSLRSEITRDERRIRDQLAALRSDHQRLERSLDEQRPGLAKRVLRWPLLDVLGRPLSIEQIWLPELTIDYNFREVARFDRCVTCHQAIGRSAPGAPGRGLSAAPQTLRATLRTEWEPNGNSETAPTLEAIYGLRLAERGILVDNAPTVELIRPRSPAAWAKLSVGDVILEINGEPVHAIAEARARLLRAASTENETEDEEDGIAVELEIRRGLPQPYTPHPRLNLFVGSLSPHPLSEFGCTICHDGQGSATEFKFAAHTPNQPEQRRHWQRKHDWFRDPHWDFPMLPRRFSESRCLKCHHAVTDLEPTERFPEPPAPKLVKGYHLVRRNGCFGCHEIDGYDASGRRIGPDMRLEPDYASAALQLLAGGTLSADQRTLAQQIVGAPADPGPRRDLVLQMRWNRTPIENPLPAASDSNTQASPTADPPNRPAAESSPGDDNPVAAFPSSVRRVLAKREADRMLAILADDPSQPGTMRKVGPSLRATADRLSAMFLFHWTRAPSDYRPETRMPTFYGLHEHLSDRSLAESARFEPVELHAMAAYLLAASQPVGLLPAPPQVTESPSAERGRELFQTRGCLACHKHEAFPEGQSLEGPDLSQLGSKFTEARAAVWLVDWIRDPARHAPRTIMPNALLGPEPLIDTDDVADIPVTDSPAPGKMIDPAADIAAFLLQPSRQPWRPGALPPLVEADLDALALEHLAAAYPGPQAEQILAEGIPFEQAATVQGDAIALLGPMTLSKKLDYVGRRTIRKRGCAGCHDIPGFEQAQRIGPALSGWGRKQESLLAFEQVHRFLDEIEAVRNSAETTTPDATGKTNRQSPPGPTTDEAVEHHEGSRADADDLELVGGDAREVSLPPLETEDRAFYRHAIGEQRREGFVWQKLHAPRSFDYRKALNKSYNERLTMGRFDLSGAEREAIITFVLGLVDKAPAEKYVYAPDARHRAVIEGRKVLDRFACAECHTMALSRWQFEYDPEWFEDPPELEDFEFLQPEITPEQVAASLEVDYRGLGQATVVGRPRVDGEGQAIEDEDYDGNPLYFFTLWEPAAINGRVWKVGGPEVMISQPQLTGRTPPWGGAFARLLFPAVVEQAREEGGATSAVESWGWVPPPLEHEGRIAQPAWLHRYLLNPTEIRPSVVLRMPKYTLSSDEATRLVEYFAAASAESYPYVDDVRGKAGSVPAAEAGDRPKPEPSNNEKPSRLDRAMRLVLDRTTYCAKCHLIGDFTPGGQIDSILAPDLSQVGRRIRPDYVRRWLANPKAVLPYTGMPVNFPPTGPPLGQNLFPGSSLEQLDAVTDLLLNYDWYVGRQVSIRDWIKQLQAKAAGGNQSQHGAEASANSTGGKPDR